MASATRNLNTSKEASPEETGALMLRQRYRRTGEVQQASRWSGTGIQAEFKRNPPRGPPFLCGTFLRAKTD